MSLVAGDVAWTPLAAADRLPLWWIALDPDGGVAVAHRGVQVR
jgi:hypothetical protein